MACDTPSRWEKWYLTGVFCAALAVQFYCTTLNWKAGFMPHHEFRQAQTAIVSYYIDQQNNFSLFYETPIVGKPWVSILLEVPVYEWSVVVVSRITGLPHIMAARTVTLACFYLALPARYLLLGRLGLPRPRRLLVLALILTCPVYIFYSRAFLMDSMEMMFCAWFLVAFVRTIDERRWIWLALAIVTGLAASLIKSIFFAVWLPPAVAYGAWQLWRDLRARSGWRPPLHTILWGAATILPGYLALRWWVHVTDGVKTAHAGTAIFTSASVARGTWGLLDPFARFSPKIWSILLDRWREAIAAPWIIFLFLAAGLVLFSRQRKWILSFAGVFFLAQFMFPNAYAYQDYYYYACAVFLMVALGYVLIGLLDSRVPKWCSWGILFVPLAAQLHTYWNSYRPDQVLKSDGGFNYTDALRKLAPKNSVIIVAGADWAAMIPLYTQRKALMIRNGLEYDAAYLHRAFEDLAGENVSALLLLGPLRSNRALLNLVADRFNMDSSSPTFSQGETDVYFARPYIGQVQDAIAASLNYPALTIGRKGPEEVPTKVPFNITPELARNSFRNISPAPFHGYYERGVGYLLVDGKVVLGAHPDCDLWIQPPAGTTYIKWDYGIIQEAWDHPGDKTDGVEFIITGETPDGNRRRIFQRVVDPANHPADRGEQHTVLAYQALPGEHLIFSSRPNLGYSYDWAYWAHVEVK